MPSSYIDTYYRRTLASAENYPVAEGRLTAEICIVGGGLAGLTAALELARAGRSVLLLEAERVAWGASGRNGGFVSPGYATSLSAIERRAGREQAEELYRLTMEGVGIVRRNIESLGIADAAPSPGIMRVLRYDGGVALQEERDAQEKRFGRKLRYLGHDETQALLRSPKYHAALADDDAFHFHPLNYARGLAREIQRLGGTIHEGSPVLSCELEGPVKRLRTAQASIEAEQVLFTTGGYTGGLFAPLKRSFLPIATYVLLTEAAPELIGQAIRTSAGIGDDRRAGDYYRLVEGGSRILWGGRITTRTSEPRDVAALLRREMVTTYPQLAPLKVELAWSGLMSYARHLMPQIGQYRPGVWYCTAFGGHGMNTTAIGGTVIAEAIRGDSDRFKLFAPFGLSWNGGPFGTAAVQLTYWSYQAADALRERRQ
ncbi:oxidoreductase [Bosea thiooxidans]|uniref:Gamma-glutamylputrescine oxidase n=1 Tax=Bosea thiooxidans TaxID=53254 RepID=A0A0Q3M330_9HYPH|nr:FAD-binding oxidoreductase [Bosea thiooxidans]KQK30121.1 oxidoreductase [Bosea thiooxidans]SKC11762.1 gamma-glutamylputrescine oxidase [Bosea thiooxidans]